MIQLLERATKEFRPILTLNRILCIYTGQRNWLHWAGAMPQSNGKKGTSRLRVLVSLFLQPVPKDDVICVTKEVIGDRSAVSLKLKASSNCVSSVFYSHIRCTINMFGRRSRKKNKHNNTGNKNEIAESKTKNLKIFLHTFHPVLTQTTHSKNNQLHQREKYSLDWFTCHSHWQSGEHELSRKFFLILKVVTVTSQ